MQTVADMRGVGVKNREKSADVLCGWPLTRIGVFYFTSQQIANNTFIAVFAPVIGPFLEN